MGRYLLIVILIGNVFIFSPLFAQDNNLLKWTRLFQNPKFRHISIEKGLSQSTVTCITQDRRGFLWFGTEDGLNRFDGYSFKHYKTNPMDPYSISSNHILCLFEDHLGQLWVGTEEGGLNRYDRFQDAFSNYKTDYDNIKTGDISNNDIQAIYEDSQGFLWLGTNDGGINRSEKPLASSDEIRFTTYIYDENDLNSISHNNVTSIVEDKFQNIWIGTYGGGLNKLAISKNSQKFRFYRYTETSGNSKTHGLNQILSLNIDMKGNVWIGTPKGLIEFDPIVELFNHYHFDPQNPLSLSNNYVRVIYRDRANVLWAGTDGGGLNKLIFDDSGPGKHHFVRYQHNPNNPHSISDESVESIFEDRSGVLWIGVYKNGLDTLILQETGGWERDREMFSILGDEFYLPVSLSHKSVNAIVEDDTGDLWIGTDGGGLNQIIPPKKKGENAQIKIYQHHDSDSQSISDNTITCLYKDRKKNIWIGTFQGGLNRLDQSQKKENKLKFVSFQHQEINTKSISNNFVMSINQDHLGNLWIGNVDGGLNLFHPNTGEFSHFFYNPDEDDSISDNSVFSIFEDKELRLWIGTAEGLNLFDRDRNRFIRYFHNMTDLESLSNNHVLVIYQDQTGNLWIGTNGGGLNKVIFKEVNKLSFQHFTLKEGLPSNVVLGILEDRNNHLWLSTNHGISHFDPQLERFYNYEVFHGLQGNEFNQNSYYKTKEGEFFMGGSHGLNIFFPSYIHPNNIKPAVVITDFQLFNKSISWQRDSKSHVIMDKAISETDSLHLSYRDNVISFEFAALHFVAPEKNLYAYRMEGLERDWSMVGNRRFVTYSKIPPGEYIFRVKGANCDHIWNEASTHVAIYVAAPFWQTKWFLSLLILFFLLVGVGIFQLRVHQLKKRKKVLESIVNERTKQLEEINRKLGEANRELTRLATQDSLTKIANIRQFYVFFNLEWRRAIRKMASISLIIIDVDYFKLYNDNFGHQSGDQCLKSIAQVVNKLASRSGDLAARYGGDEFIVVLSDTDLNGAIKVAEKIKIEIDKLDIAHPYSTASKNVTVSMGCASVIPKRANEANTLIKKADEALYQAKQTGRHRIVICS